MAFNTFSPNTQIKSADVNTNFTNIASGAEVANQAWTQTTTGATNYSSLSVNVLRYQSVGKIVFCSIDLEGTSNNTSHSITLPFAAKSSIDLGGVRSIDNVTSGNGRISLSASSTTATIYPDMGGSAWTNSATNDIIGEFFYERT